MDESTMEIIEKTKRRREALEKKKAEMAMSPKKDFTVGGKTIDDSSSYKRRAPLEEIENPPFTKDNTPPKRQKNDQNPETVTSRYQLSDAVKKLPAFDHLENRPSFKARKGRLANLASNINAWDDDLHRVDYRESPEKPKKIWTPPKSPSAQYKSPEVVKDSVSSVVANLELNKKDKRLFDIDDEQRTSTPKLNDKTPNFLRTTSKKFSPVKFSPTSPGIKHDAVSNKVETNIISSSSESKIYTTPKKNEITAPRITPSSTSRSWKETVREKNGEQVKPTSIVKANVPSVVNKIIQNLNDGNRRESLEPTKMPVQARMNIWEKRIEESEAINKDNIKQELERKFSKTPIKSKTPVKFNQEVKQQSNQKIVAEKTPIKTSSNLGTGNNSETTKIDIGVIPKAPPLPTNGLKTTDYKNNLQAMGYKIDPVSSSSYIASVNLKDKAKSATMPSKSEPKDSKVTKANSIYRLIKGDKQVEVSKQQDDSDDDFYEGDETFKEEAAKSNFEKISTDHKNVLLEDNNSEESYEESVENDTEYSLGSLGEESDVYTSDESEDNIQENDNRGFQRTLSSGSKRVHFKPTSCSSSESGSVYSSSSEQIQPPQPMPRRMVLEDDSDTTTDDNHSCYISIDMYRRSKVDTRPPPMKTIVRQSEMHKKGAAILAGEATSSYLKTESIAHQTVNQRIKELEETVIHQQNIISQTSNALNTISDDSPFAGGSVEQVECNRLLLISCKRREAALSEMHKIRGLGKLPIPEGPRGSITLSDLRLPLKPDYKNRAGTVHDKFAHFFIVSLRQRDRVVFTEMMSTHDGMARSVLDFPNMVKFSDITQDFKIDVQVYSMSVPLAPTASPLKRKTPKKHKQSSNNGPSVVRISNFAEITSTTLTMRSLGKTHFSLERVPMLSPLSGSFSVNIQCSMESTIEECGWLTMFEDVSGLGAWYRRWCKLKNDRIMFWKYPSEEKDNLEPIGYIDMKNCITEVIGLIPRDICARPNTFELVCIRRQTRSDQNSLTTSCSNTMTTTRHWLSADTKEERIVWCDVLNEALLHLRTWNVDAMQPIKAPPQPKCKYESTI